MLPVVGGTQFAKQFRDHQCNEPIKFLCPRGQSGIFKREKQTLINYFSTENQLLQQNNGVV